MKKHEECARGSGFNPAVFREFRVSVARELWFTIQASQEHLSHESHEMSRKEARELSFVTSTAARHEERVDLRGGFERREGLALYFFREFRVSVVESS